MVVGTVRINAGIDATAALCKGLTTPAIAVDANINISVLWQLPPGHCSNNGGGNIVMLAGGRRDKSRWQKTR